MTKSILKSNSKLKLEKPKEADFFEQISRGSIPYYIIFIISICMYLQTVSFGLTLFDDKFIVNNLDKSNITMLPEAFTRDAFFNTPAMDFYRPMQSISYLIDRTIGG